MLLYNRKDNKMYKYFVALSLSIISTTAISAVGKDGYEFPSSREIINDKTAQIRVVYLDSQRDLLIKFKELDIDSNSRTRPDGEDKDRKLYAFSLVSKLGGVCTIYIVKPTKTYKPEILGHEVFHCLEGDWHNDQ